MAGVEFSRGVPIGCLRLPALRGVVEEVRLAGFARSQGALGPALRFELLRELEDGPFEALPEEVGPVRQPRTARARKWPATRRSGRPSGRRRVGPPPDSAHPRWPPPTPRHQGLGAGISPHRDHKRYAFLVAVFTLVGEARFSVVGDRAGQHVLASWMTAPGDLCLLRAPGFDGNDDGRPLHAVAAPTGEQRISLAFRMDRRAARR